MGICYKKWPRKHYQAISCLLDIERDQVMFGNFEAARQFQRDIVGFRSVSCVRQIRKRQNFDTAASVGKVMAFGGSHPFGFMVVVGCEPFGLGH